jgi:predicted nucleic acid-binding protein
MLATSGVTSPKQFAELSEFSGSNVIIKDLNTLRNKDILRLNLDYKNTSTWSPITQQDQNATSLFTKEMNLSNQP